MTEAEMIRFADKVVLTKDDCWEWQAQRNHNGYGQFRAGSRKRSAHCVSYEHFVGAIPEGMQLDHLCRNRACANFNHLESVTPAENIRRGDTGIHGRNKTHCPNGHPYDTENTYLAPRGGRRCRTCHRQRENARYHGAKPTTLARRRLATATSTERGDSRGR